MSVVVRFTATMSGIPSTPDTPIARYPPISERIQRSNTEVVVAICDVGAISESSKPPIFMIRGRSTAVASNVTDWEGRYVSRIIDIWIVIVGGDRVVCRASADIAVLSNNRRVFPLILSVPRFINLIQEFHECEQRGGGGDSRQNAAPSQHTAPRHRRLGNLD